MGTVENETDSRFPSGKWTGFYLQPTAGGYRHLMELVLTFGGGILRGEGRDVVGEFVIQGRYEVKSGRVTFRKQYVGQHAVAYAGWNEGQGIWGTWDIYGLLRGGFHIWPEGMADPTTAHLHEVAEIPTDEPVLVGDAPQ